MLRTKSTRKRVASAVARECAEMSRASVESSKNKKRTRKEDNGIQDEANHSGSSQADVNVEASVGNVCPRKNAILTTQQSLSTTILPSKPSSTVPPDIKLTDIRLPRTLTPLQYDLETHHISTLATKKTSILMGK